jgi:CHRD domain
MIRRVMRPLALLLLVTLTGAAPVVDAQGTKTYRARLSPVPLDVAMQATIAGSGSVTATLTGTSLVITGTFKDLKTAATVVRLHRSPKMGMRGPAIGDLTATAGTSGTITGKVDLTVAQVDDLANGRIYVQLHSEKAPDGNLWGWLIAEGKK